MKIRHLVALIWLIAISIGLIFFVDHGFLIGMFFTFMIIGAIVLTVVALAEVWDWYEGLKR